jgi:CRP/FNR family transcriptional regulator
VPAPCKDELLETLRACRLWRGASDDAIAALAARARTERLPRGAVMATEGEHADRFAVVVRGKVKVLHIAPDGRELTFETIEATEPVGAVSALAGARQPASIQAATDVTVAWLPRDALFDLMQAQPDVSRAIIADLAKRVVNFTAVTTALSLDVPSRLAGYLFQRALAQGAATPEGLTVGLGTSKTDLASSLGTVPETLSRAFARLRDEGVLEVRGGEVLVFDFAALAKLGSGAQD